MLGGINLQSLIGLALAMALCWALSENRRAFPWKLALAVVAIQIALVLLLFGVPVARAALQGMGHGVDALAASSQAGTAFIFGYLAGGDQPFDLNGAPAPFLFAFRVLPVILVICALSALLWHWRILKWITKGFGFVFQRTMGLRGPPALATAATIFMGQVEGPIFIRAYLDRLSRSELFTLMTVGLSCVSGSTMIAYATILKDALPNAAAHVLTASLISAPAGVLLARIMIPPKPGDEAGEVDVSEDKNYDSTIDAIIKGTGDGLTVLLNVAATLIVFVAFAALVDKILGAFPDFMGQPVSLQRVLGAVFAPLAFAVGVPWNEAPQAGSLLGTKLVLTEITAFIDLSGLPREALSERSRIIMTYALCGFANIASMGITVAGFNVLVPARRDEIISMAARALFAGFLATCMTGAVVALMPPGVFALG